VRKIYDRAHLNRASRLFLTNSRKRQNRRANTAQKNRNRKPVAIEIPLLPVLQKIVGVSPTGDLTFLVSEFKRPFTPAGFGNWFRHRCNEAGLKQCSAHGLLKAGAAIAAENGATTKQLMSNFGSLTMKEAECYTQAAERKRMAGEAMRELTSDR
jgi:hypothetical protein